MNNGLTGLERHKQWQSFHFWVSCPFKIVKIKSKYQTLPALIKHFLILIKLLLDNLNILYSAVFCFCFKVCFRLVHLVKTYWNNFCVWQKICGIWSSERRRVFSIEKCRQSRWEGQPHYSPSGPHVPASPLDLKCRRTFRWWEWNPYTCYTQVRHAVIIYSPWCFPKTICYYFFYETQNANF